MALKGDAEQIKELAHKIVMAEIRKAEIVAAGGVIYLDEEQELPVSLTNQQRQVALAVVDVWKQTIKDISAAW